MATATTVRSVVQAMATHISMTLYPIAEMNCLMHPLKETMPLTGVKMKTKQGTGLDTETMLSTTSSTTVYVYNTDCFPPINNSHNGDPHFPSTVDVTKGQADAATHGRGVDYQYEPVSSTDSLLRDLTQ